MQRQEAEQDLNQRLNIVQNEKKALTEKLQQSLKQIQQFELEKREIERTYTRLEKDKHALKKTLDKVEREKMRTEEIANRTVLDRSEIAHQLQHLEEENAELNRQVQRLQSSLAEVEQMNASRIADITSRHRSETEVETDRIRATQQHTERLMEARERAYRSRIKGKFTLFLLHFLTQLDDSTQTPFVGSDGSEFLHSIYSRILFQNYAYFGGKVDMEFKSCVFQ